MIPNNQNKFGKSALGNFLSDKKQKLPTIVPPVLQQVGKLAAGVATVSTGLLNSGSATGNPRNKCALQPGHSLMDWIRLGASGKDLTGVGSQAGRLAVTKHELSKHNKIDDIWLAIRGKVYNVTAYIPFHPGGPDELMRAAGIDATRLFDQVHPWVNYDQILQKCLLGRLVSIDPAIDTSKLFGPDLAKEANESTVPDNKLVADRERTKGNAETVPVKTKVDSSSSSSTREQEATGVDQTESRDSTPLLPRFDWIQRMEYITVLFYTRAFSNPFVELYPPNPDDIFVISLTYDGFVFRNEIVFYESVEWPCTIKVSCETGKVELVFRKTVGRIWENYGLLRQQSDDFDVSDIAAKYNFVFSDKAWVCHNIVLMKLERSDGGKIVVPIGQHVRAFVNIDGQEWSRIYTPVPNSLFTSLATHLPTTSSLCLMIKRYENGNVSRYIADREKDDMIYLTRPFGDFNLSLIEKKETFLMLAAGTGITPMFGLLLFLLERRIKKCQFLRLLFFNKSQNDIPFRNQLENLEENDSRFKVTHILSEPEDDWTGLTGHIKKDIIENALLEHIKDTGYTISNIFTFICGPNQFVSLTLDELAQVNINEEQIYVFQG